MSTERYSGDYGAREITFAEMLNILWVDKWLIGSVFALLVAIALIAPFAMQEVYVAEAVLSPVTESDEGLFATINGLADGAGRVNGVKTASDQEGNIALAFSILRSKNFIVGFIRNHKLEVPLIAASGWDAEREEWIVDSEKYDPASAQWVNPPKKGQDAVPSAIELYDIFMESVLRIEIDKVTNMLRLSVSSQSPVAAKTWTEWLIRDLDQYARSAYISDTQQTLQNLVGRLNKLSASDSLADFYQARIDREMQKIAMAESKQFFLVRPIDEPLLPELPVSPNRGQILILGAFFGLVFGVAASLIKRSLTRHP